MMSIFLNLKKVDHAVLALHLQLDLAPSDKIDFELGILSNPLATAVTWFGEQTNYVAGSTLQFDLNKYCGKEIVEFRIVFRSRLNSFTFGHSGVSINRIEVISS